MDWLLVFQLIGSLCVLRFVIHAVIVFKSPDPRLPKYMQPGYRSRGIGEKAQFFLDGTVLFLGAVLFFANAAEALIWWVPDGWGSVDDDGEWTSTKEAAKHFVGFWGGLWGVLEMHHVYPKLRELDQKTNVNRQ